MYLCCVKDPKIKKKTNTTRFLPRQKADLTIAYDVLQAYGNNYMAQVIELISCSESQFLKKVFLFLYTFK